MDGNPTRWYRKKAERPGPLDTMSLGVTILRTGQNLFPPNAYVEHRVTPRHNKPKAIRTHEREKAKPEEKHACNLGSPKSPVLLISKPPSKSWITKQRENKKRGEPCNRRGKQSQALGCETRLKGNEKKTLSTQQKLLSQVRFVAKLRQITNLNQSAGLVRFLVPFRRLIVAGEKSRMF